MNYYDILQISAMASIEVIKMAYKALAKKYHPDIYPGDKSYAEAQMKLINEAYEILSNPLKRQNYDRVNNINSSTISNDAYKNKPHTKKEQKTSAQNSESAMQDDSYKNTIKDSTEQVKRRLFKLSAHAIAFAKKLVSLFLSLWFIGLVLWAFMPFSLLIVPILLCLRWKVEKTNDIQMRATKIFIAVNGGIFLLIIIVACVLATIL